MTTPSPDADVIERLRSAIDNERRHWFCSGADCEPFDHGRDEGFEKAMDAFDKAAASIIVKPTVDVLELIEQRIRHFDRCIAKAVEDDPDDRNLIGNLLAGQHALRELLDTLSGSGRG